MMKYSFESVDQCSMCGSPTRRNKVLGKRLNQPQGLRPRRKVGITTTIVKCKVCGLIYANPLPIPENIQDHYGIPPTEYWNDNYFVPEENYFKSQLKTFKGLYQDPVTGDGLRALDIGAGIGKCMTALMHAGFESHGIEPSDAFYEMAINRSGVPAERLKLSCIENTEFEDSYFDFITFGAVLEHLYNPSTAIKNAVKWLKGGGLIHAEVPSSSWLVGSLANLFYRATFSDYVGNLSPMHPPYHLYEFGLLSFRIHGQNNGYELAHHQYHVCETFMPRIIDPILKRIMSITKTGMQLEVWLKKLS